MRRSERWKGAKIKERVPRGTEEKGSKKRRGRKKRENGNRSRKKDWDEAKEIKTVKTKRNETHQPKKKKNSVSGKITG